MRLEAGIMRKLQPMPGLRGGGGGVLLCVEKKHMQAAITNPMTSR